jgi:hypothetical protein
MHACMEIDHGGCCSNCTSVYHIPSFFEVDHKPKENALYFFLVQGTFKKIG